MITFDMHSKNRVVHSFGEVIEIMPVPFVNKAEGNAPAGSPEKEPGGLGK